MARGRPHALAAALTMLVLGLSACERRDARTDRGAVPIAPGLTLALPRPDDLGRNVEALQLVTARYRGQTFVFESRLSVAANRLLAVALDSLGRRALRVRWTPSGVETEAAAWLPRQVRAEHMLADLVIIFWPEETVRGALAPSGGRLISGPDHRSVLAGGKEIARAEYEPSQAVAWSGHLRYRNFAWDYELDIRSTEAAP